MTRISIVILFLFPFATGFAQQCTIPDLIPFRKGKMWGFSDGKKKIRIAAQYEFVEEFGHVSGLVNVVKKGKSVYINKKNEVVEVHGELFEEAMGFTKILRIIKAKNGKFGLWRDSIDSGIRKSSVMIVDSLYEHIELDRGDIDQFVIAKHQKTGWGILNIMNNQLTSFPEYDSMSFARSGYSFKNAQPLVLTYSGDKMGWQIFGGKEVVAPQYEKIAALNYYRTFLAVHKDGKWALSDHHGKLVTGFKYKSINKQRYQDFYLYKVGTENDGQYYIDCKGTEYFEK
jgi:hypothetical protein